MPDTPQAFVQRAQRFKVRDLESIYATIEREPGREPAGLEAEPIDISEGGCKLRVAGALSFEESFTLVVGCVEGPLRLTLSCRVAWLREEWEHCWLVGCQFIPNLPAEAMEEMFCNGVIERRQYPRYPVSGEATVQWELQSESFSVQSVDISEAGFCIRCPQTARPGQRLRLSLGAGPSRTIVQAKTQWCMELDQSFLVGCAFLDRDSYSRLRAALDASAVAPAGNVS
ncbi:MAG: PilZ domain-containing protein [Planctomycetes bacterium]|nr:PilZ domain-containing protein [Planctomycetota bacterium]